jgi:hypothetical protein
MRFLVGGGTGEDVSHLRCWEFLRGTYPGLTPWANVFRASGAGDFCGARPPENGGRKRRAYGGGERCVARLISAGGAAEVSPAREGWETWQVKAGAP